MKKLNKRLMFLSAAFFIVALTFIFISQSQSGVTKSEICHFGQRELVLGEPGIENHLSHGDCLGPCPCEN